jgi:hypothetical protein
MRYKQKTHPKVLIKVNEDEKTMGSNDRQSGRNAKAISRKSPSRGHSTADDRLSQRQRSTAQPPSAGPGVEVLTVECEDGTIWLRRGRVIAEGPLLLTLAVSDEEHLFFGKSQVLNRRPA